MQFSPLKQLATWFCVLALGQNATVFAGGWVCCIDSGGNARLEWGCEKTVVGACSETRAHETDDESGEQPAGDPCEDAPIDDQPCAAGRDSTGRDANIPQSHFDPVFRCTHETGVRALNDAARPPDSGAGPPPSMRLLRTVILLI